MTAPEPVLSLGLRGKTVLITGGSRNIGLAVATQFAASGADVAILARSDVAALEAALALVRDQGVNAVGILADLRDPSALSSALHEVEDALGPVDVLVNNAAIRPHAELTEISVEAWDIVLEINLRGPFLLAQALLGGMRERGFGRIINISGLDAFWSKAGRPHVIASKAGIIGLTRALAAEAARDGVTANVVVPGTIDTVRHTPAWYPNLEEFYAARSSRIPMGRLGRPDEVASVVLFLASSMASYVTGQTLFATGGAYPMVREA